MTKRFFFASFAMILATYAQTVFSQPDFKYGFGGGINFAQISEVNSYSLYEDLTGNPYSSNYSGLFSNIGNQYFFHGELVLKHFVIALKPGFYTFRFSKTDQIDFVTEPVEQTNTYLLRYLQIPLEIKYMLGNAKLKPFIGGAASYGHLLQQGGNATYSFIRPKISVAPIGGAHYSFTSFELVLTGAYNLGMHSITGKDERFLTDSDTPYSQSDIKLNDLSISLSVLFYLDQSESKGALDCPAPGQAKQKQSKPKNRK